jgi:NitT/TauT family transport system ATP-binding protein
MMNGDRTIVERIGVQGVGLTLRGVRRVFPGQGKPQGAVVAVEAMNLDIPAGQFLAILGPSGCGKSTLLRLMAGLDKPDAGSITLHDSQANSASLAQAYVFQDAHLLPWRSVQKNVELPLELMGVSSQPRARAAQQALEQVGLSEAMNRYPAQLSGGMRMRVSLARALVTNPRLLLLDEPFAALDEITRQELDEQLISLWQGRGMTVIFVTHSIHEATYLAQRALVLTRRPARLVLDHLLDLPADRPPSLRSQPGFARQTGILFDALRQGEAQP